MSERNEGASISEISGIYLGGAMKNVMRVFSVVLLVMVGTVFAVGPAGLLQLLCSKGGSEGILSSKMFWLILILVYYFIATFLSIDPRSGATSVPCIPPAHRSGASCSSPSPAARSPASMPRRAP